MNAKFRLFAIVVMVVLSTALFALPAAAQSPELPISGQLVIPWEVVFVVPAEWDGLRATLWQGMGDDDIAPVLSMANAIGAKREGGLAKNPSVIRGGKQAEKRVECATKFGSVGVTLKTGDKIGSSGCYSILEYNASGRKLVAQPVAAVAVALPTKAADAVQVQPTKVAQQQSVQASANVVSDYGKLPQKGQLIIPFGEAFTPPASWDGLRVTIWRGMSDGPVGAVVVFGESIAKDRAAKYGGKATDYPTVVWSGHPMPGWTTRSRCDVKFGGDAAVLDSDTVYGDGGCFEMVEYDFAAYAAKKGVPPVAQLVVPTLAPTTVPSVGLDKSYDEAAGEEVSFYDLPLKTRLGLGLLVFVLMALVWLISWLLNRRKSTTAQVGIVEVTPAPVASVRPAQKSDEEAHLHPSSDK